MKGNQLYGTYSTLGQIRNGCRIFSEEIHQTQAGLELWSIRTKEPLRLE
jgi:hypothetical protein